LTRFLSPSSVGDSDLAIALCVVLVLILLASNLNIFFVLAILIWRSLYVMCWCCGCQILPFGGIFLAGFHYFVRSSEGRTELMLVGPGIFRNPHGPARSETTLTVAPTWHSVRVDLVRWISVGFLYNGGPPAHPRDLYINLHDLEGVPS